MINFTPSQKIPGYIHITMGGKGKQRVSGDIDCDTAIAIATRLLNLVDKLEPGKLLTNSPAGL